MVNSKLLIGKWQVAEFTHPEGAPLFDPLFAFGGKRVKKKEKYKIPSLPLAVERVVGRSNDRVSQLFALQ